MPAFVDRTAAALADIKANAAATAHAARRRSQAVDVAFLTYERDKGAVGSVLAGAMAFRLFVYLLPLCLAILTLLGVLAGIGEDGTTSDVGSELGFSRYVIDSVETAAQQSRRSLWVLVPLAVWAMYTAGVDAAKVLRAIHALAWEQPIEPLRRSYRAAAMVCITAVATALVVAGMQVVRQHSPGYGVGTALLSVMAFAGIWLVVSMCLPHDERAPWHALIPGALLVGGAVWLAHLVSAYWLATKVQKASEMYGSLGVAAAILAWLYLLGRSLVASAMLNATLWSAHRDRQTLNGSDSAD